MEKTGIRLTKIIGIYLLAVAMLLVVVTAIFIVSFKSFTGKPADATEKLIKEWLAVSEQTGFFDLTAFPESADYVLKKGDIIVSSKITNCDKDYMAKYVSYLIDSNNKECLDGQDFFTSKQIDDETIFIHYSFKMEGEILLLIVFIALYLVAVIIPSVVLIYKLRKMIYTIAEEKWRKEYETKQEMAQIAHDLKTPLTVIRGNADLLLESNPDAESVESINAIIDNAERIAKSVLKILEK